VHRDGVFEHILVPLDGTPHPEVAIHPAVVLASQSHTQLLFASVVAPGYAHERRHYLSRWERAVQVVYEVDVVFGGVVADQIIAAARVHTPSLVCMASHGRGPLGQALFGSTSTRVIHEIGAPVLAIGPHCAEVGSYSEVVVAVDESDESAAVLPAALDLAVHIDAKLQIVQVIDNADLRRAQEAGINPADLRESGHVAKLAAQLARRGLIAGWEVLHDGDPAHGIVDYLREKPSAIVALATHARSGLSLLSHHSVATHVVHRSANPVLLLH
jgi:nucleotide-binding universal stress UspA family protein